MKENKGSRKGIRTIVAATTTLVLSLLSAFGGTFAWFMSQTDAAAQASQFQVMNRNASIKSVRLIKFVFPDDGIGGIDYTRPNKSGDNHYYVKGFYYDFEGEPPSFGETVDDEWVKVDVMNLYDPLETFIQGTPLIDFNSNAIFEVTFSSNEFTSLADLRAAAVKLPDRSPEEDETLLSTCVDFDIYTPEDLAETGETENPLYDEDTETYTKYIPSYLTRELTELEKVYYKISYLSSLEASHVNFYEDDVSRVAVIGDQVGIDFVEPAEEEPYEAVAYINVNYAPEELKQFREAVTSDHRIRAIYDYFFSFTIS